jgi:hypothetical protein
LGKPLENVLCKKKNKMGGKKIEHRCADVECLKLMGTAVPSRTKETSFRNRALEIGRVRISSTLGGSVFVF